MIKLRLAFLALLMSCTASASSNFYITTENSQSIYRFLEVNGFTIQNESIPHSYSRENTMSGYVIFHKNSDKLSFTKKTERQPWETQNPKVIEIKDLNLSNFIQHDMTHAGLILDFSISDINYVRVDCTRRTATDRLNIDSRSVGYICKYWGNFSK